MNLAAMTDDQLDRLRVAVRAEQEARAALRAAPSSAAALVDAVASGRTMDPITVTRDGRTYTLAVQEEPSEPTGVDVPSGFGLTPVSVTYPYRSA